MKREREKPIGRIGRLQCASTRGEQSICSFENAFEETPRLARDNRSQGGVSVRSKSVTQVSLCPMPMCLDPQSGGTDRASSQTGYKIWIRNLLAKLYQSLHTVSSLHGSLRMLNSTGMKKGISHTSFKFGENHAAPCSSEK